MDSHQMYLVFVKSHPCRSFSSKTDSRKAVICTGVVEDLLVIDEPDLKQVQAKTIASLIQV